MKTGKRRLPPLALLIMVLAAMGWDALSAESALAKTEVVIFAAASTTHAVTEVGEYFSTRRGIGVTFSFAASSTLARQISNGAPADIYLSASVKWMDYLQQRNLIVKESRKNLLGNRMVFIAPPGSQIRPMDVSNGITLTPLLGKDGRLVIGDPLHVPAGIYAKEALVNLKIWDQIKDRLAPMKDVRAALVMVERAEAPLGIVYATDAAISKSVRSVGLLPDQSHTAIVYPVALVSGARITPARQFLDFLSTPEAKAVFVKYGFEVR